MTQQLQAVQDRPDHTGTIYVSGSVTIPIAIESSVVVFEVKIVSSTVTLDVNIESQTVNLNVNIAASAVILQVNIASQTANLNVNIAASVVTLNVAIQSSAVTLNVNISSQTGNLNINIAASAVTLNVAIQSSAVTLNVNISSQTANLNVNIAASAVTFDVAIVSSAVTFNVLVGSTVPQSRNLILNSGFESGILSPWILAGGAQWAIATDDKRAGTYSAKNTDAVIGDNRLVQQVCEADEATFATFVKDMSFKLCFSAKTTSLTGTLSFRITERNSAGGTTTVQTIKTLTGTNAWAEYEVTVTILNSLTRRISVEVSLSSSAGSGSCWIDEFYINRNAPEPGLAIDITAQSIGNLKVDIAAQTVGNVNVTIASAVTLNISITAQTVGISVQGEWQVEAGNLISGTAAGNLTTGQVLYSERTVGAGKRLFVYGCTYVTYSYVTGADNPQECIALVKINATAVAYAAVGEAQQYAALQFNTPMRIDATKTFRTQMQNVGGLTGSMALSWWGYEKAV